MEGEKRLRPTYFVVVEILSVVVFAVYILLIIAALVKAAPSFTWLRFFLVVLAPVFGYILADFFSGFVHFLGDNFGSENTPFFGPNFIHPFRNHHIDEKAITRHGFLEVNGTNCLISLFLLIPLYHLVDFKSSFYIFLLGELAVALFIGIFLTNQFHKWAHAANPPKIICYLQNKRLILSPGHHQVHHTAPFATYYCITSGWLNKILQKVGFFEGILKIFKKKTV